MNGQVLDSTTRRGVPLATVQAPDGNGVVADMDGKFFLDVPDGTVLMVRSVGYPPTVAHSSDQLTIEMVPGYDLDGVTIYPPEQAERAGWGFFAGLGIGLLLGAALKGRKRRKT